MNGTPKPDNPKAAIVERLRAANRVLITAHENPDGDALGSALALAHVLSRLGKHPTVALSGRLDPTFSYLDDFASILSDIKAEQELMIVLDERAGRAKNVEVRRLDADRIALVLTPDNGPLEAQNITFEKGSYPYDCVVVLDCPNLEQVGALARNHANLFGVATTLAVDHHPNPTGFATHNLTDTNAAATAEIMVSLLESLGQTSSAANLATATAEAPLNLIDEHVATALLTGLLTDTGSFQNSNTTPKSLTVAAQLLAAGAAHHTIVKRVFATKSLAKLRLWGRALASLKEDQPLRFAWATLTRTDFVAAQAKEEDVAGLIDELLKTAAGLDFVLLLSERAAGLHGSLRSVQEDFDVAALATLFGGGGHRAAAAFSLAGTTLNERESSIINTLRDRQRGAPLPETQ